MKTIEMAEASAPLAEFAESARSGTVVVTRNGRPVAAVISIEGSDLESLALATNPDFMALIDSSRKRVPPGRGVSTEEMRRRLAARAAAD